MVLCTPDEGAIAEMGEERVSASSDDIGQRRFAGGARTDDADEASVQGHCRSLQPRRIGHGNRRDHLGWQSATRRHCADERARFWLEAGLTEGLKSVFALYPAQEVLADNADGVWTMGVATVETGLAAVPVGHELINGRCASAEPELPLLRMRGKDDVRRPLDLLAERRERRVPLEPGRAVVAPGSDGHQDVAPDPGALFPFLSELGRIDRELARASGQGA